MAFKLANGSFERLERVTWRSYKYLTEMYPFENVVYLYLISFLPTHDDGPR